jgi:hypothetical protein
MFERDELTAVVWNCTRTAGARSTATWDNARSTFCVRAASAPLWDTFNALLDE